MERRQLALDLHDDLGQQLTGLKLHLQRLGKQMQADEQASHAIGHLTDNVTEAFVHGAQAVACPASAATRDTRPGSGNALASAAFSGSQWHQLGIAGRW